MALLGQLIDLYCGVLIVDVLLSWVIRDPTHPLVQFVDTLTAPVLKPLRALVPTGAGLDFSPMIAILILQALRQTLV